MDSKKIKILKEILLKEKVEYRDILGLHTGIIHELRIRQNGIFAYCPFFGQNLWLRLNESTMEWEEAEVE